MPQSSIVPDLAVRAATLADVPLILAFIKSLAQYEKLSHEVSATEASLRETLFGARPSAEVLIAELADKPVGFALFFHNYSTFLGKPGLYLEDLFVEPEARRAGVGKALLIYLAKLAESRGCGRFEWWVLDWNKDAIAFYKSLGARAMDDWTVFRVDDTALTKLAARPF
jgi:GNAT superfamily N-acetyltransferase